MVQAKGSITSPTLTSLSGCSTTTNSPAPSQADKINTVKFNCRVREPDVITAVWELAPAPLARTIKIEIATGDVSKTAKTALTNRLSASEGNLADRLVQQIPEGLRGSTESHREETEVPSDRLQSFPRQEQKVDSITIVKTW